MYRVSQHGGRMYSLAISRPAPVVAAVGEILSQIGSAVCSVAEQVRDAFSNIRIAQAEEVKTVKTAQPVAEAFNPGKLCFLGMQGCVQSFRYAKTTIHVAFDGQHLFVELNGIPEQTVMLELLSWFGMDFQRPITCMKQSPESRYYVQSMPVRAATVASQSQSRDTMGTCA